jgi:hypothetical protein
MSFVVKVRNPAVMCSSSYLLLHMKPEKGLSLYPKSRCSKCKTLTELLVTALGWNVSGVCYNASMDYAVTILNDASDDGGDDDYDYDYDDKNQ